MAEVKENTTAYVNNLDTLLPPNNEENLDGIIFIQVK